ncbi:MAG: hypothetical protein EOO89_26590, partial [Pedobacter sp.]
NTSGTWSPASGTNNTQNYIPGVLAQTTQFRRTVTGGVCASNVSAAVTITVNPLVVNNTITANQTICTGTAATNLSGSLPTGGNGTYVYLWEQNTSGTWAPALGTNNTQNYVPGVLTQTTKFRRMVTGGVCASNISTAVTITVNPLPTATISGTETICQNSSSAGITFTGLNGVAPYTFTYKLNNGAPQTIVTTSGNSINLPQSTLEAGSFEYSLLSVSDSGGAGCTNLQTGAATISVSATPKGFNDYVNLTSCSGVLSYNLQSNVNDPANGNSVPSTFSWIVSSNNNIVGAVNGSGNLISQTLINTSNTVQTVIYTIIPKASAGSNCTGLPFTLTVDVPVCSSLSIVKTADLISVSKSQDKITYMVSVSNTGNANQYNVVVNDPMLGGDLINPVKTGNNNAVLEKGEMWTYTGTYLVTQSDLDNNGYPVSNSGKISNSVTVKTDQLPVAQAASADVNIELSKSISLVKT